MPSSPSPSSSSGRLPVDGEKQAEDEAREARHRNQDRQVPERTRKDEETGGDGDSDGVTEAPENWQIPPEPDPLDTEADGVAGVVNRVLSRISTRSSWNPGPPPDGGRVAWLMCFCAHLSVMNTWGFINSFGVFQSYYATTLGRPPSDISWIGSIQVFLTFFIGTFTGRVTDAGFFRPVMLAGTAFMLLGIFATSAATSYWQLLLSQGLCMGLASGCIFCPAVSVLSTYFARRRSLAIGIAACGSVTGGLVFPAMARQLLPSAGFPWAVRAMGFVQLATLAFVNVFMRTRLPPRRTGGLVEWGALRELEFAFYCVGMFFNFWGVYFGFYYLAVFARTALTPPMSEVESLNLLLLLNGVGLVGRLVPNHVADRTGPLTIMAPVCVAVGAALFAWVAVRTPAQLYGWSAAYGIAAGAVQSLFPAGLSSLTTDLRRQGARMGLGFTIVSFAVLTGNPIAGAIIAATGGRYEGAQAFTGGCMLLGACMMAAAKVARMRRTGAGWSVKV
ncbi:MFS general substrate transporter [Durotheca rogersii]|uniref:MFS general substrate transporter n=1 Tax=Durotheca rogersii TaxID=419775 RepID=UPI00221F799E|nr:MFS general substrate transporter [Durotheca rogersii]KAI5859901.1 MFS general substrate transporter [Durotheca rogersii]